MKKDKTIVLSFGAIICLVLAVLVYKFYNRDVETQVYVVSDYRNDFSSYLRDINHYDAELFTFKSTDNLVGYIDTKGQVAIEAKYKYANEFCGKVGLVTDTEEKDYLINTKGEVIAGPFDNIFDNGKCAYIAGDNLYYKDTKSVNSGGTIVYQIDNEDNSASKNGFFGFKDKDGNNGIIRIDGKLVYDRKIKSDIKFEIDSKATDNVSLLAQRYCKLSYDDKNTIFNCDTGVTIFEATNKEQYELMGCNLVKVSKNGIFEKEVYINNDKVSKTFESEYTTYCPGFYDYIELDLVDEHGSTSENQVYMYPNGNISTEKGNYNVFFVINYLMRGKYEITWKTNGDKKLYGVKKGDIQVIENELEDVITNSNNSDYIIGYKNNIWILYDLKNTIKEVISAEKMDFINKDYIYYATEAEDENKILNIYSLEKGKSIKTDVSNIYLSKNFLTIVHLDGKVDIYNNNLEIIYKEYE